MVWFNQEECNAITIIHQLINTWATSLDRNAGVDLEPVIADDCVYVVRGAPRHGPAEVVKFYRERLADLEARSVTFSQRHAISNLLVKFSSPERASVDFLLTFYMAMKPFPITDFPGPIAVADCHMDVSRGADGHWRISSFDSVQNFSRAPA